MLKFTENVGPAVDNEPKSWYLNSQFQCLFTKCTVLCQDLGITRSFFDIFFCPLINQIFTDSYAPPFHGLPLIESWLRQEYFLFSEAETVAVQFY